MAQRQSLSQASKEVERKKSFASEYSIGSKAKLELGAEAYVIPLGMEYGVFHARYHDVKARKTADKKNAGFLIPSFSSVKIKCKCYDDEGNRVQDSVCGSYAQSEYDKYPEKEDAQKKRLIGFPREEKYIPVMILGSCETDTSKKQLSPTKIDINTFDFSYLALPDSTYKGLYSDYGQYLKDANIIDIDLEGEELEAAIDENFTKCIIKIECVAAKTTMIKYAKKYSFIHFTNPNIAKSNPDAKMKAKVTQYMHEKLPTHEAVANFLQLFEQEVDGLLLSWEDDALAKYIDGDKEANTRSENLEKFKESEKAEAKQKVEDFDKQMEAVTETEDIDDSFLDETTENISENLTEDLDDGFEEEATKEEVKDEDYEFLEDDFSLDDEDEIDMDEIPF